MSDGSLSQDEIDALLQGTDDVDSLGGGMSGAQDSASDLLSQAEHSSFLDLINSASENVGGALGAMIGRGVTLSNPRLEIINLADLQNQLSDDIVEIKMDFEKGTVGEHSYIVDEDTAKVISGLMMGQESGDLTEASLSAVSEAMNVISGNELNTIGTTVKKELRNSPPTINKIGKNELSFSPTNDFVKVVYDFKIEGSNVNQLIELYGLEVVKDITSSVVPATNEMVGAGAKTKPNKNIQQPNMGQQQQNTGFQNNMMGQQNMMGYQPNNMMGQQNMMQMTGMQPAQVQSVQFSNFNNSQMEGQAGNINLLMDVNMELTVELGRTKKSIKDILGMGEGTVIELDKLAGEPVDILVNGKLIARGEVVVIDENFGVRVTEIISPMERIRDFG
jgi:flagellar motor switch protein FliN